MPLPLVPAVIAIQDEPLLLAVQLQPEPALTVMLPLPPLGVKEALVGEMEYVQLFTVTVTEAEAEFPAAS